MPNDALLRAKAWPLFRALSGQTPGRLGRDVLAGLTLAAIAVPEQIATARLGGFAPQIGLFAFVSAAIGFAVLGSNRTLSSGADSTITPIFAGSLLMLAAAGSPQYLALAAALALMVGLLLAIAGLFKLGWIADLLSAPILTGFLAGIALHIVISQAPSVLGLTEGSGTIYGRVASLFAQAQHINPICLTIGLGVFAVTWSFEKIDRRIPGALIAVVGAMVATATLNLGQHGVAVLGQVNGGLPPIHLPHLGWQSALRLVGLAFVIALVVMVQTSATSRAFGGDDGDPDIGRDFLGVGLGSILAGLFGAFPVNASPPRTAIVTEAGGCSQYAGLFAASAVLVLATVGAPLLAFAPTAALGGILLFVAQRIFHGRAFADILRQAPSEFALALLTTALIVILPIQTGVAVGIFLSLAHGVFTITRVRPVLFERAPGSTVWWPASSSRAGETEPGVLVIGFQAPLFFLNAYDFRRGVLQEIARCPARPRLVVLEASSIVEIDFTASAILSAVIAKTRAGGTDFAIARLESVRAQAALDRFGVTDRLAADHLFQTVDAAIRTLTT